MLKNILMFFVALVLFTGVASSHAAEKQTFPTKPVRLIVPYVAGSGNDFQTRGLVPYAAKYLGARIVIDNRPGADGRLGMNDAWKSRPDGYTLINAGMPTPLINEKLFQVNYRTKEFIHIYAWSQDNICLVVNADVFKTAKDFINEARTRTMAGGITGIGSVSQIAGLALADAAGFKAVNWVPYKGGGETMTSLAGKHIDFGITTTSSALPLADAGKLRVAMIYAHEKDIMFPQAPLPKDLGFDLTALPIVRGVMAPPKTPAAVTAILGRAFAKAAKDPDFLSWAKKARVAISPLDGSQFLKYTLGVEKEVEKYIDKMQLKK